jgi:thiamine biosynthesis lipoprotein
MGADVVVGGATAAEVKTIAALFAEWERVFSRFRADSELSAVNAGETTFVAVSPLFAQALAAALAAANRTEGLVDPTLGVAIEAAGYDRDFGKLAPDDRRPSPTAPGSWRSLRLAGRLLFRLPGTKLDLNCVVKSLAVDRALELIEGDGFVAAGGDVAARGGAVVGLPDGERLVLRNGGVATSGTTRRRWVRGGELQHHLLDPRSGRPARSRWCEVTVAAPSCLEADVAAKAAFLLSDEGPAWLDRRSLPGRFSDGERMVANQAWRALVPAAAAA